MPKEYSIKSRSGEYWKQVYDVTSVLNNAVDFLRRLDEDYDILSIFLGQISPGSILQLGKMQQVMDQLIIRFDGVDTSQLQKILQLEEEEISRLDEAFECLVRNCYWSAVVNSAVAFEHRLFSLLKEKNEEKLRDSDKKLRFIIGSIDECLPQ